MKGEKKLFLTALQFVYANGFSPKKKDKRKKRKKERKKGKVGPEGLSFFFSAVAKLNHASMDSITAKLSDFSAITKKRNLRNNFPDYISIWLWSVCFDLKAVESWKKARGNIETGGKAGQVRDFLSQLLWLEMGGRGRPHSKKKERRPWHFPTNE